MAGVWMGWGSGLILLTHSWIFSEDGVFERGKIIYFWFLTISIYFSQGKPLWNGPCHVANEDLLQSFLF